MSDEDRPDSSSKKSGKFRFHIKTRKFGGNWGVGVLRKVSIDRCSHSSSSEMWMTRSLSLLLTCAYVSVFDGLQRNEDVLWLASKKCWTELLSLLKKGKYLRFSKQSIRGMQIKPAYFWILSLGQQHCPLSSLPFSLTLLSRKKLEIVEKRLKLLLISFWKLGIRAVT